MFVGHYGIALASKRFAPKTSLGLTFLAVQLLDILFAPAILIGLEHAKIVPGYLPASPFVFYDFPWTHGLLMAIAWSWLVFRLSKSLVLGACVFSHWILDWIVHSPDLPLYRGGPVVGLGLWHFRNLTFLTETALLILGLLIYLRATRPKSAAGKFVMPIYVVLLIALDALDLYSPQPTQPGKVGGLVIFGEVLFFGLAGIAAWLDRFREPLPPEPQIQLNLSDTGPASVPAA